MVGLFSLVNILVRNTGTLFSFFRVTLTQLHFNFINVFNLNESFGGNSEFAIWLTPLSRSAVDCVWG